MERPAQVLGTAKHDSIELLNERRKHPDDADFATEIDPAVVSDDYGDLPWRPNRYGYLLIVGAIMTLIVLVLEIQAGAMNWYLVFVLMALMLFEFLVGFKLIKKRPTSEPGADVDRGRGKLDD